MNDSIPLFETNLTSLPLLHRGKVRDIYAVDEHHLLIIQTDRLSAFDVICLRQCLAREGADTVIHFWFEKLSHILLII